MSVFAFVCAVVAAESVSQRTRQRESGGCEEGGDPAVARSGSSISSISLDFDAPDVYFGAERHSRTIKLMRGTEGEDAVLLRFSSIRKLQGWLNWSLSCRVSLSLSLPYSLVHTPAFSSLVQASTHLLLSPLAFSLSLLICLHVCVCVCRCRRRNRPPYHHHPAPRPPLQAHTHHYGGLCRGWRAGGSGDGKGSD